jgi:hypothetical protein
MEYPLSSPGESDPTCLGAGSIGCLELLLEDHWSLVFGKEQ